MIHRAATSVVALLLIATTASAQPHHTAVPSTIGATRMCQDYANGTLTVEVLSSSILWGSGASRDDHKVLYLLSKMLAPGQVWNGGAPGSMASDYAPGGRYYGHTQFAKDIQPSLVILEWRINEQYAYDHDMPWQSPAFMAEQYGKVIEDIRSVSPSTAFLIVNAPTVLGGFDDGPTKQQHYVDAMWTVKDRYQTMWLDLMHYFPRTDAENATYTPGLQGADAIHPGDHGHAVMAAAIHQRIHASCG